MNNIDLDLKEIQIQQEKLFRGIGEIQKILTIPTEKEIYSKEFYTVEDCAKLKGGGALNTFKSNRFLLPGCGNPQFSHYVAGRLCFSRNDVMKWVKVSDADYLNYAKECGVSAIPEKYKRLAAKAKGELICG